MKIIRLNEANEDPKAQEFLDKLPEGEKEHIEDLEDILNIDIEIENPTMVTNALDRSLERAISAYNKGKIAGKAANILFVGRAGTGKTAQVKKWAKDRGVNLVMLDAKTLEVSDLGGAIAPAVDEKGTQQNYVTQLGNKMLDVLDEPGSVLFLDELNRARPEVMGSLLTLILDHTIADSEYSAEDAKLKGGAAHQRLLKGFLFTVACINPTSGGYEGVNELDMAMRGRFRIKDMGDMPNTQEYLGYMKSKLEKEIKNAEELLKQKPNSKLRQKEVTAANGRLKLATTILKSPLFQWDTADEEMEQSLRGDNYQTLSPRDFSAVINACDGTKEDLIDIWSDYCNDNKQDMIEQILTDYVDVDDKANSVFKDLDNEESDEDSIFGAESDWDKVSALL